MTNDRDQRRALREVLWAVPRIEPGRTLEPMTTQISLSRTGSVCRLSRMRDNRSGSVIAKLDRLRA